MRKLLIARYGTHTFACMMGLILAGCAGQPVSVDPQATYYLGNAAKTPGMLTNLKAIRGKSVRLEDFDFAKGVEPESKCAALGFKASLQPPKGKSYQQYVRDALAEELSIVDAVSQDASQSISGKITQIALLDGSTERRCTWRIALQLKGSNGRVVEVQNEMSVLRNLQGNTPNHFIIAGSAMILRFNQAVRETLAIAIAQPDFPKLFDPI